MNSETTTERPPRTPDRLSRYAWLPLPLLIAVIAGLWVMDLQTVYELRFLLFLLNFLLTGLAAACIGLLTARSFLASGHPGLLMFGCGALLWGLTAVAAAGMVDPRGNLTVTVHNLGVLGAALCHFGGMWWRERLPRPRRWLVCGYAGVVLVTALLAWVATAGWTPAFFVQGQGGTPVRQAVLLLTIALLAWVALQILNRNRQQPVSFYLWYGLGLALLATGLTGILLQSVFGSLLSWAGRLSQYLGSVYLFIAAIVTARETGTWAFSLEAVEEAWHKGEFPPSFEKQSPFRWVVRYGLAVVAVAAALGLRLALEAWVGPGLPTYITFYPAVMVVALLAGFVPGLVATALTGYVVVEVWIIPPIGEFSILSPMDRLGVLIFSGMGLFMSAIASLYRSNQVKAAAYEREAALRERDQHLRLAYAAANSGAWEWSLQTNKNIWSDELWGLYGLELNSCEPSYEAWRQSIHPDDRAHVEQAVQEAAGKGQELSVEWRVLEVGGTERWLMLRGQPLQNAAGAITRYIGIVLDVTERKRAENTLRLSEQRLRLTARAAKVGLFEWDTGKAEAYWSREHYEIYGLDPASPATFEAWLPCVHPDDRDRVLRSMEKLIADARSGKRIESHSDEYRAVRPDGTVAWLETTAAIESDGHVVMRGAVRDITERKQADEALRKSEERLRLAQDVAGLGTWDWSTKTGTISCSPEIERLYGVAPGTVTGYREWRKLVHPEDIARVEAVTNEAITNRSRLDMEFRIIRPSGELRWVAALGGAIYDGSGEVVRVFGVNMDITERKRAEKALQESEQRFKLALKNSPVSVAIQDRNLVYQWAYNQKARRTDEIIGRTDADLFAPEDVVWINEIKHRVLDSGTEEHVAHWVTSNGQRLFLDLTYEPLRDSVGEVIGIGIAAVNLTNQKLAERALRESEAMYRSIGESIDYGVWACAPDGRNTYASESFLEMVGITQEQCSNFGWGDVLHPDDAERTIAAWQECVRTGGNWDIEHRFRGTDGKWHYVLARGVPIKNEHGEIIKWAGINLDISQIKQAEEQIRVSLAEKEVMLKEIHHRVKNNRQVISSLVSLQADNLTDERTREEFDDVCDRVRSMALIHEKLYQADNLARLNFADYSTSLLHSLWSSHDVLAEKVKLTLALAPVTLSIETAVPCGLILNELAGNALKHAFPNDSEGEVTVGLEHDSVTDTACLWVRDNGVGLAPGLDWRQSRSLGLRLVQILAGQLHGTVETGTGPGAEFRVTFPLNGSPS